MKRAQPRGEHHHLLVLLAAEVRAPEREAGLVGRRVVGVERPELPEDAHGVAEEGALLELERAERFLGRGPLLEVDEVLAEAVGRVLHGRELGVEREQPAHEVDRGDGRAAGVEHAADLRLDVEASLRGGAEDLQRALGLVHGEVGGADLHGLRERDDVLGEALLQDLEVADDALRLPRVERDVEEHAHDVAVDVVAQRELVPVRGEEPLERRAGLLEPLRVEERPPEREVLVRRGAIRVGRRRALLEHLERRRPAREEERRVVGARHGRGEHAVAAGDDAEEVVAQARHPRAALDEEHDPVGKNLVVEEVAGDRVRVDARAGGDRLLDDEVALLRVRE